MEKTSEKKIFQTRKLCIEKSCKKRDLIKSFTLITFNTAMYIICPDPFSFTRKNWCISCVPTYCISLCGLKI